MLFTSPVHFAACDQSPFSSGRANRVPRRKDSGHRQQNVQERKACLPGVRRRV